jgi:hypothetical protein
MIGKMLMGCEKVEYVELLKVELNVNGDVCGG